MKHGSCTRLAALAISALAGITVACKRPPPPHPEPARWCLPDDACWPTAAVWAQLRDEVHGALEVPRSPWEACRADAASPACAQALADGKNPFALQDQPGGTESTGGFGAWIATPSAYAIVATSAADVAAGVRFAHAHRLRLAIKGTGHDYLGRSSAPGSLLIWTHRMREVTVDDGFVPRGCAATPPTPAVTVGAGTRWIEAYQEVTGKHQRYVQGGGCTTVGAAGGFLQGGGFGSWSKRYGVAAASLLEAEVVTADGAVVVANACQHADLFWALRGGGGGTFGVVTQATLMTHPLPTSFGSLRGAITAADDDAFRALVGLLVTLAHDELTSEHWGEQVQLRDHATLRVSMTFVGITAAEAEAAWQPLRAWVDAHPGRATFELAALELPATQMWSFAFFQKYAASAIRPDERPGATPGHFWWAGNSAEVATYWYAYTSWWLPLAGFAPDHAAALTDALVEASRHWTVGLHFNKGQAGAAPDAIARGRATAMNPAVFDAAALALVAAEGDAIPGVVGHEPDPARAAAAQDGVHAAMAALRAVAPGAGSYGNEADYFEPDWQRAFWGDNYPRLLAIKRTYDPDGVFSCHHCVGSEGSAPGAP